MKKQYVKPDILFEDFALSTNIAAGCETLVGNQSQGSCTPVYFGRKPVFTDTLTNLCEIRVKDGVSGNYGGYAYDGLCYHVPSEDKNVFMS